MPKPTEVYELGDRAEDRPFRMTLRSVNEMDVTVWAKSKKEAMERGLKGQFEDEDDDQAIRAWVKRGSVEEL